MRTALIISGLPRYVEKSFPNINQCLIEPNNPDIFIHTWKDADGTLNYPIAELYRPKMLKAEMQKTWRHTAWDLDRMMKSHARSYHRDKFVEMLYSSWYSIQQSNMLKEEYRLKNDIVYDCVIRARFDIHFNRPVVVTRYNQNILNVSNKWLPDHDMTDDRFAFASNAIMNAYCGGFNMMDAVALRRNKMDGIYCGETLVYEICRMFDIKSEKIADLTCNNVSHMVSQGLI